MITTTPSRVLRTFICIHPPLRFPIRTTPGLFPLRRRPNPPCLQPSTPRSLSTTSSLLSSSAEASSKTSSTTITTPRDIEPAESRFHVSPTAANPPATTRPAPLDLPTRNPDTSTLSFYFATGKAYLTFYKTGLKNIYLNTRLVWSLNAAAGIPRADTPAPGDIAAPTIIPPGAIGSTTRSNLLLRRRWRYDVRRLPLFALFLLVCGEFTPFVVMAMPSLVPYTCRIPRQIEALQRKAEQRRAASFKRLEAVVEQVRSPGNERLAFDETVISPLKKASLADAQVTAHIARSLNLISPLWDRLGVPDTALVFLSTRRKVQRYVDFLREDDALLVQAGGVDALESQEVVLACADRAIDTLGQSDEVLRERLRRWLQYVPGKMDATAQVQCLTDYLLKKHG